MSAIPKKVVFLSGPEDDGNAGDPAMKFRLTYEGELRATQRDARGDEPDKLAPHKQAVRRQFHEQLKTLWTVDRFLRDCKVNPAHYPARPLDDARPAKIQPPRQEWIPLVEAVASQFPKFGYRFVPLVLEQWFMLCSLDILFLRRDIPGSALHAGDIDNRVKTLIDALRPPRNQNELVGDDVAPRGDEDPFFCLLEDDKQVSHFAVETDRLLDAPTASEADKSKARVIITVELRTWYPTQWNSQLVG